MSRNPRAPWGSSGPENIFGAPRRSHLTIAVPPDRNKRQGLGACLVRDVVRVGCSSIDSGPGTECMTAQGQPRARFRRAIQRKNLLGAEMCAREMGVVDLVEALDLVCLVAEAAPERFDGFARRWLARLADERPLALGELDLAVTALRALPSSRARAALRLLCGDQRDGPGAG
jgi:hypothetical protein